MAEPVASVLTLAAMSLTIIRKTIKFIQEAHKIDARVRKLSTALEDLQRLINTVDSTCRHVKTQKDDPSQSVRDILGRCSIHLKSVDILVGDLALQKSGTFLQKVSLKCRSDRSKKEIENAIHDIENLMGFIQQATICWNLRLISSVDRRLSEVLRRDERETTTIITKQSDAAQIQAATPKFRKLSDAETMCEPDCITAIRINSAETQKPRSSVSSNPSRSCRTHTNNSNVTIVDTKRVKQNRQGGNFHHYCTICEDDASRIEAIRTVLRHHPDSAVLANSTDRCQRSPLHLAAQRGNVQLARMLVEFSADIDAKDSQPRSVLDLAIQHNQEHFVEFLLEQDVDENGISKQNRDRFAEMKDTIEWDKEKARKAERKRKGIKT